MSKRSRHNDNTSVAFSAVATISRAATQSGIAASSSSAVSSPVEVASRAAGSSFIEKLDIWAALSIIIECIFVGRMSAWMQTSKTMLRCLRPDGAGIALPSVLYMRSNFYSFWDGQIAREDPHNQHTVVDRYADMGESNHWTQFPHKDMDILLSLEYEKMFYRLSATHSRPHKGPQCVLGLGRVREFHIAVCDLDPSTPPEHEDFYLNHLIHLLATECFQLESLSLLRIPGWVSDRVQASETNNTHHIVKTMDDRALHSLGQYAHQLKHLVISVYSDDNSIFSDDAYPVESNTRRVGITPRGVEWLAPLKLETLVLDTSAWSMPICDRQTWEPYRPNNRTESWEPYPFETLLTMVHTHFGDTLKRLRLPLEVYRQNGTLAVGFRASKLNMIFEHVTHLDTGYLKPELSEFAMFPNLTHLDIRTRIYNEAEFAEVLQILQMYPGLKYLGLKNNHDSKASVHKIGMCCRRLRRLKISIASAKQCAALLKLCPNLTNIHANVYDRHNRPNPFVTRFVIAGSVCSGLEFGANVFVSRERMSDWAMSYDTSALGV